MISTARDGKTQSMKERFDVNYKSKKQNITCHVMKVAAAFNLNKMNGCSIDEAIFSIVKIMGAKHHKDITYLNICH